MKNFKIIGIVFLVVATIGFLDATYLTVKHYKEAIPPCTIDGCEVVLVSPQSKIAGLPVALFGSFYYLTLIILAGFFLYFKKRAILNLVFYLTIAGFVASLYFVYLQIFVIKAICQYCMFSATTSTILFIFGLIFLKYRLILDSQESKLNRPI